MTDPVTAPDMVSIIAAALVTHACEVVYYIGGAGHISCHGCDGNWASFTGFHDHQARAVLDAISEAGAVEWGVRVDQYVNPFPSEGLARKAVGKFVGPTQTLVSRIPGPWTAVEG